MKGSPVEAPRQPGGPRQDLAPGEGKGLTRRSFLLRGAAPLAAGLLARPVARGQQPELQTLLQRIGKDGRLIVHSPDPGVFETPLELLRQHRITPRELLFVRNNQILPGALTLDPFPLDPWSVELVGQLRYPRVISGGELASRARTEVAMVLQCSGNGRSLYAGSVQTRGTQWGKGGVGHVRWRGVPLAGLIEELGVGVGRAARFVTAEGRDAPAASRAADFEHSLPLEDVLDRGLLALEMNGEPIPALHGGPVRLIVPGYYGTMNVKWLQRLRFEAGETPNYNHIPRYRMPIRPIRPGSTIDYTLQNSRPTWEQPVKSLVWNPSGGQVRPGRLGLEGVAWNDGAVPLEAVLVSADGGSSWLRARLETPPSPYSWYPWSLGLDLPAGDHRIWVRAVDASGRSQPLDGSVLWNPSGYGWNGVEQIRIRVRD